MPADRFRAETAGTGGGGWVHPKGANSMAMSGFDCETLTGVGSHFEHKLDYKTVLSPCIASNFSARAYGDIIVIHHALLFSVQGRFFH